MASSNVPAAASAAVLVQSEPLPHDAVSVRGPDFDQPLSLAQFLGSYERIGFQATSLGRAIEIVNKMVCMAVTLNINDNERLRKHSGTGA